MNEINETIVKTMDNEDIHKYLPDAKIITDIDLLKYDKIEDVFDNKNKNNFLDSVIILFVSSDVNNLQSGHWTALNRIGDMLEFFDSYGNTPNVVYDFTDKNLQKQLGTDKKHLTKLLNKYKGRVVYNPIDYQESMKDVNTCGRHVCYRIITMIGKGFNLIEYYDWMKHAKEYYKFNNYDEVVSKLINE